MHIYYPFHGESSSAVWTPLLRICSGMMFASLLIVGHSTNHSMYTSTSTSKFADVGRSLTYELQPLQPNLLVCPVYHSHAKQEAGVCDMNDPQYPRSSRLYFACSVWDPPGLVVQHRFDKHGKWDPTKDLMVPFQHYSFNAFAFAIDPITNYSVRIATFGVLDILGDFVVHSRDVADTNEFTFNSGNGSVTTQVESRLLRVEITQSAVAKAFAICIFLANWALTVGSVYITTLVAFRRLNADSMVAALPFSALLTIPTIRSLYIDSPPLRISIGKSCAS